MSTLLLISLFVISVYSQGDAVEHFAEQAMKLCKKLVKERVGDGDGTIWHFSKHLCSTLQDQLEAVFEEQIAAEAEAMSKKPSAADKFFELPAIAKAFAPALTTAVEALIKEKAKDPTAFRRELAKSFEPVFFRHLVTGKPNQKKSEPTPASQDEPVKVVVGNNFKEIVTDAVTDVFLEFYAPWCGHCQKLEPIWKTLGDKYLGKPITIAKINAQANDYPRDFEVNGFPTIFYIRADQKKTPIVYNGARELKDFMKFIEENRSERDWALPPLPKIKSESAPENAVDENGVTVVVADTLESLVLKSDSDVFIEFYAPWCGHCKALEPKWNELAKKLNGKPIVVAKFNADANEVSAPFAVQGFPTLYYLRKDRKKAPISFDGERDVDAMIAFIDKHRSDKSWALPGAHGEKYEL